MQQAFIPEFEMTESLTAILKKLLSKVDKMIEASSNLVELSGSLEFIKEN